MHTRPTKMLLFLAACAMTSQAPAAAPEDPGTPSSAPSSGTPSLSRSMLSNGGFEKGLEGWKVSGLDLVEDPAVAHRGLRCLLGEVRKRRQGKTLQRSLRLRADRLYRLSIWARADNGSRLTVKLSAGKRRGKVIGNWHGVGRRWHRFRVNFTVPRNGPATLTIVAPSSFWAPTGRMWIDDLSLTDHRLWPQHVAADEGMNDFPSMVAGAQDRFWLAWLAFQQGRDRLQIARYRIAQAGAEPEQEKSYAIDTGPSVLDPRLAADGQGGAWLVYSAEQGDNWDIHAVHVAEDGPGKSLRVTRHPGSDMHPAAAVQADGTLWLAWETNRDSGRHQIALAAVRSGQVGSVRILSQEGANAYQPDIACLGAGGVVIAWHAFADGNADLYARSLEQGMLGPLERLTRSPGIDRHVRLLADGRDAWLSWEHACYSGYQLGAATTKRVLVARLRDGVLRSPRGTRRAEFWSDADSPVLAFDHQQRLWLVARVPRDRSSGWDVVLWHWGKEGWSPPRVLSRQKGMRRSPSLVPVRGGMAVCYQGDDMPGRWMSVDRSDKGSSRVLLTTVRAPGRAARPLLSAFDPPRDPFEAIRLREQRGDTRDGWTVEVGGKSLRLLFGDLHEHTEISVCDRTRDESPDESYQMMRDLTRCDFGALTDHGKNFNAYLWHHQAKRVRANSDIGRFLPLLALEWTSSFEQRSERYPYGYYGHRNLILSDARHRRWYNAADGTTPADLWAELRRERTDFVLIPHQLADTGNVPVDWSFHDEAAEPVAEIFQFRGSYECKGCAREARNTTPRRGHFLQDAWRRGVVIGVVASPDHRGGLGKAAVYAESLDRKAILAAIRARRTFGTTGARILLDFRIDGRLMGEVLPRPPAGSSVELQVRIDCPASLSKIDLLRNNEVFFTARPRGKAVDLSVRDRPPVLPAWYYVRVVQMDGEMAWSSPIWLGRPDTTAHPSHP
ncbi:MAG: DUF3604 domain-containing protein [Deltaproteobacteria bacterium]|nr:DUF3604 domain-containing protein [Deltaproteobacteria bacterium]